MTIHTPQPTWTGPGVVVAVVVLVVLGAIRGTQPEERAPTPREVAVAEQSGTSMYTAPDPTSGKVRDLANGQTVTVLCHTEGPESSGWGGPSRVWDRVSVDGLVGYVADTSVNTHVPVDKIADAC
ncbi:MAG: SH3 domain-containing protein [Streptomycetaceae bacterium]|nr:SH3 domain-containing protein [Streptomycetaceae bacterium]